MRKLTILAVVALIGYGGWNHFQSQLTRPIGQLPKPHDKVIMYSLTTCGWCVQRKREMLDAGIRFAEYYIDKDPAKEAELHEKLTLAGISTRRYGTPVVDVRGFMLPNNPSLKEIQARLNQAKLERASQ